MASEGEAQRIVNASEIDLKDAVLVEGHGTDGRRLTYIGNIGHGAEVPVEKNNQSAEPKKIENALDPTPLLRALRDDFEDLPENEGEVRLVAWTSQVLGGQKLEPAVDRHRGVTVLVVHLREPSPPSPDAPRYNLLAPGPRWVSRHRSYTAQAPPPLVPLKDETKGKRVLKGSRSRRRPAADAPAIVPIPPAESNRP